LKTDWHCPLCKPFVRGSGIGVSQLQARLPKQVQQQSTATSLQNIDGG
jgi:hypothetical protein